jgi:IclR family pca regulon transcriptional regulator
MDNSRNFIASLARGLAVLGAFTKEKKFLTLTEISNMTGINKTATQRLTHTLQQLGYLERDESKLFRLGPSTLPIGLAVLKNLEIRELAYPYLKDLSKKLEQTVNLSILDETEIVVIERFEVRKIIDYHLQIGSRLPAHCTSAGKAILAFLPEEKRDIILNKMSFEKLTEHTITDQEQFRIHLEEIKDKGYALNSQELALGSRTTAAPIFSRHGQVVAAVSISANASLFSIYQIESELSPYIVESAEKISAMLGYDSNQMKKLMNLS